MKETCKSEDIKQDLQRCKTIEELNAEVWDDEGDQHYWTFVQSYSMQGKPPITGFSYLCILMQGRPQHINDYFSGRHPPMDRGKRAKLFAPFDALAGFDECIDSKNIQYCQKVELDEEEKTELNRRLTILHNLTFNSRLARANHVAVQIQYYVPCTDSRSFSYKQQGRYILLNGIVQKVDMDVTQTIVIGDSVIHFDDILSIEESGKKLFTRKWDD